jgi:WD40 repeat protein
MSTLFLPTGNTPEPTPSYSLKPSGIATVIAAGQNHTCAITEPGGVKCWGENDFGQLGDGTTTNRNSPVDVSGLTGGIAAISAGRAHTCALTAGGGVKCWGENEHGELGNSSTVDSAVPVDVNGLTGGATAIAAGDDHTCAVTTSGGVKCWGVNESGQLGDGTTTNSSTPVDVTEIIDAVKNVVAGGSHTCALTVPGGVLCWGNNEHGQLGDGKGVKNRSVPADVVGLKEGVSSLSANGGHTCALMTNSGVKCWGDNNHGQLGDGTTANRFVPVDLLQLGRGISAVSVGSNHTCALTGGAVKCWGWNYYGQLGDGTKASRNNPETVGGIPTDVGALAAGGGHTCALTGRGGVLCWGRNSSGQLGDGTTFDSNLPVDVGGLKDQLRMSALRTIAGYGPIAFSPDGKKLAVPWKPGSIKIWDVSTGMELPIQIQQEDTVSGLQFSPDGKSLLCSTYAPNANNYQIKLWDIESGRQLFSVRGEAPIAISPDGTRWAYSYFTEVRLADMATGKDILALAGDYTYADFLAFSPDSTKLVTGEWSPQEMRIWDVATGRAEREITKNIGETTRFAFSPDWTIFASMDENTILIWDFEKGIVLRTLSGLANWVGGMAFSPDGKWFVSGDYYGGFIFWDTASWIPRYILPDQSEVYGVVFSPDGGTLASWNGVEIVLWGVAS